MGVGEALSRMRDRLGRYGLLTPARALRRLIAKLARLGAAALDGFLALTGAILRVAMRRIGLMRRMLVIARLEMLELLSTLACRRHEASDLPRPRIKATDQ
jgi:hypothetical protein